MTSAPAGLRCLFLRRPPAASALTTVRLTTKIKESLRTTTLEAPYGGNPYPRQTPAPLKVSVPPRSCRASHPLRRDGTCRRWPPTPRRHRLFTRLLVHRHSRFRRAGYSAQKNNRGQTGIGAAVLASTYLPNRAFCGNSSWADDGHRPLRDRRAHPGLPGPLSSRAIHEKRDTTPKSGPPNVGLRNPPRPAERCYAWTYR